MKIRRLVALVAAITVIMGMVSCKGERDDPVERANLEKARARRRAEAEADAKAAEKKVKNPPKGYFKQVRLTPQKEKQGSSMKVEVETIAPIEEDQYLTYVLWKNSRKAMEKKEAVISSQFYKKGDMIFAEVLFHEGDRVVARKRSDQVFVENTAPRIEKVTVPEINGPGSYTFKVTASDHDGDTLAYSLLPAGEGEKLPGGLEIDEAAGDVTYVLGNKAPPDLLKFIVAANDNDGGVAKKMVSITFESRKKIKRIRKREK